jgi:hypothetical protein
VGYEFLFINLVYLKSGCYEVRCLDLAQHMLDFILQGNSRRLSIPLFELIEWV